MGASRIGWGLAVMVVAMSAAFTGTVQAQEGKADAEGLHGWIRQGRGPIKYKVSDSLFAANTNFNGAGAGPADNFKPITPHFLTLADGTVTAEKVKIETDKAKKTYLHLVPGTLGADVEAGLFPHKKGEGK